MPYAAALRELGKIEALLDAHGEDLEISDSRLSGEHEVHATKATVDRRVVAAMVAKPLLAPDVVPTYVKFDGKFYLHAGHEELMAAELTSTKKFDRTSKLLDLDKLKKHPAPELKPWAGLIAKSIGERTPEAQKVVRGALRDQLATLGIATRDDRRAFASYTFPKAGKGLNTLTFAADIGGGEAAHGWDGDLKLTRDAMAMVQSGMAILEDETKLQAWRNGLGKKVNGRAKTPNDVSREMDGIRILLHEEAHGSSPALPPSYKGVGIGIEEAATELIARKASRDLTGFREGWPCPTQNPRTKKYDDGYWCYSKYINGLFDAVSEHTGDAGIQSRIEDAVVETRKWHKGATYTTGEEQIADIASRLKGEDGKPLPKDKRDRLIAALSKPNGPMSPK